VSASHVAARSLRRSHRGPRTVEVAQAGSELAGGGAAGLLDAAGDLVVGFAVAVGVAVELRPFSIYPP